MSSRIARVRDRIRGVVWQLRGVFRGRTVERELEEEHRFHLEMEAERLMRSGVSAAEARRRAAVAFGGTERWREAVRETRWTWALEEWVREFHHALRALLRRPLFALVAVCTLGIAIGAASSLFSVVDAVVLRPLQVPDADRLVSVQVERATGGRVALVSLPDYLDYRSGSAALVDLAAHHVSDVVLSDGIEARATIGFDVSGNYFRVLGVEPALGRFFAGDQAEDSSTPDEVVISHAVWSSQFGADPGVLGRTLRVNGVPLVIVGVAPADFHGTMLGAAPAVWLPLGLRLRFQGADLEDRMRTEWLQQFGRLRADATIEQAEAALDVTARALAATYDYPPVLEPGGAALERFTALPPGQSGRIRGLSLILLCASGLLLLIAATNVAGMLLARATARAREISVRLALGAGRARLARQLLVEGLVLGTLGGAVGVGLAAAGVSSLGHLTPPQAPGFRLGAELNGAVLGFAAAAMLVSSLVFGLVPAYHATRRDLTASMRRGSGERASARARSTLLVGQVAMTLVLLVATALLVRTLRFALLVDHGFDPDGVMVAELNLRLTGYDEEQGRLFYGSLLEQLRASPDIASAALASVIPLSGGWDQTRAVVPGVEAPDPAGWPVGYAAVSEDYFATLGLPLLAGSEPLANEALPRLVINQSMADRVFGDATPVGRAFQFSGFDVLVAGVAPSGKYRSVSEQDQLFAWVPMALAYTPSAYVLLRPRANVDAAVAELRRTVSGLDPNVAIIHVGTLAAAMGQSLFLQRTAASLLGAFAGVALLLAAAGIFGLLAFLVEQRRHEISVRMAIGAGAARIVRSVVGVGLWPVAIGLGIGLLAALAVTRVLGGLLHGVGSYDPISFGAAALLLLSIAGVAAYVPARRATKVQPANSLRAE